MIIYTHLMDNDNPLTITSKTIHGRRLGTEIQCANVANETKKT